MSKLSKNLRACSEVIQGAFLAVVVMVVMTLFYWAVELLAMAG